MEYVIVGLFVAAVSIVLPIYLLFSHKKLQEKVTHLEARFLGEAPASETVAPAKQPWQPPETDDVPVPIAAQVVEPSKEISEDSPPKAFVFKPDLVSNTTKWLQKNWFFAVAAVSMALAGVFLVQYGVENGLLSPARRVMGAIGLGIILIGAGEYIRRKLGNDEDGSFALLPSAFAGAGLVALFAGVLSARIMYDLIGSGTAFIGLGLTGAVAVTLGWFYGPLLAIVGVFGALAAPFLVGGDSSSAHFLHLYFAGIAGVALAIDSIKRWAWLSVLGLIGAYSAAWLLYLGNNNTEFFVLFALITAALSLTIPVRKLVPDHAGVLVSDLRKIKEKIFPEFPTRIAAGAFVASTAIVGLIFASHTINLWISLAGLSALFLAAMLWMRHARALSDMAFLPSLVALAVIALEGMNRGPIRREWIDGVERDVLDYAPSILAIILAGSIIASLLFAWRSWRGGAFRVLDTIFAAAFAPLVAVIFEVFWRPEHVLGEAWWALYLAAVAIVMVVLAERFARKDGTDRVRTALFALSAMTMLSFMLITILGSFALTISLATMVAAAAWLGRKFDLPLLDRYVQVGVLTASWRLVLDPGVVWAYDGELWQVILTFVGAIALLVAAYVLKRKDVRLGVTVMLESAIWSLSGVFLTIMLARYFEYIDSTTLHMIVSLVGLIWLISCANQLYRIREGVGLRRTRTTLASIYALLGGVLIVLSVVGFNPLNGIVERGDIAGPYVFDSVFAAYALPGLLLAFVALRFTHLGKGLRKWLGVLGALLVTFYIGLEIRRFWHGDNIDSFQGTFDGELYSYTIAMMLVAVALLVLAFIRQSALLRKLALVMVALTVAKVYLIDMSGLDGLLRVVSFLVLGLLLAAMAWVNRILQKNEVKILGAESAE